jgi:DUF4097 and DUF4098 domain-containing protein YvlB
MNRTRAMASFAFLLSFTGLQADDRVKEDFRFTFTAMNGSLDLKGFNGSVEITGTDNQSVEVTGSKYAANNGDLSRVRVEAVQEGNLIRVRAEKDNDPNWRCNCGASFTIRVPRRMDLSSIKTSNGSIRVTNIDGRVDVTTSNGGLRLSDIRGKVDARTSNGGVEIQSLTGAVSVKTSNGGIRGRIVDTVSGDAVQLSTSNGAIDVRIEAQHNNDIVASTSNGSVTVRLPETANARINATTSSHETVTTDFPVQVRGLLSKNKLEGSIGNGGGPMLQLSTSNGSIKLLRL